MHLFSTFGFVHKIATFEKSVGFQVCYPNLLVYIAFEEYGMQAFIQYTSILIN